VGPDSGAAGRYTVISADCHAGADLRDYKPFLETRYHDAFDDWADHYVNPFADLKKATAYRNWDSTRRMDELEADGIVGEVLYPNTVPPFFPKSGLTALVPTATDFDYRLAGLRAHNRWMSRTASSRSLNRIWPIPARCSGNSSHHADIQRLWARRPASRYSKSSAVGTRAVNPLLGKNGGTVLG